MLPDSFSKAAEEIRRDNLSGATDLVRRGAKALAQLEMPDLLGEASRALVAAQPTMAPLWNLANSVLWAVERGEASVAQAADAFMSALDANAAAVVRNATQLISEDVVILTHSYSSSVRDVLVAARELHPGIRVIATESRPMCEGVTLAEELARAGIEVTLIVDSAMLRGIEKAGLVLVGADSVSTGGLTNKTGTLLLAEAARTRDVPFVAACGSEKFLPQGCPEPKEPPKPSDEITRVTAPHLSVENYYFDRTPLDRLTGIVTEDGVLSPARVRELLGSNRLHPALG